MFRMTIGDVFSITGRGTVVTGKVEEGSLSVGDEVAINGGRTVRVKAIEAFRKKLDTAAVGDTVGLLLEDVEKHDVKGGDVLTAAGGGATGFAPGENPFGG